MTQTKFNDRVDADILELNEEGVPPDEIAIDLAETGLDATGTEVKRRIQYLTGRLPPLDLEREVWATLSANLVDMDEAEQQLKTLEAELVRTRMSRAEVVQSHSVILKRVEVTLKKQKFLQFALSERLRRRETELRIEAGQDARRADGRLPAVKVTSEVAPQPLTSGHAEAPMLPTPAAVPTVTPSADQPCVVPALERVTDGSETHSA
jgi:hypothetical protein